MPGVRQILGKAGPGRELEGMQFSSDVLCAFVHRFDDELSRQGRLRREGQDRSRGNDAFGQFRGSIEFFQPLFYLPLLSPKIRDTNIRRDS